jgi:ferritin-like metal-binding protein YciE
MQVKRLHDLFLLELQDLYSVESQIIEALPKMIQKTTNPELKRAFTLHLDETRKQAQLIEDLCREFDVDPEGKHCLGIEGIIEEGQEMMTANNPSPLLDLAMIGIAQKVEHYEIASYGTATNYAQELGLDDAQDLLFGTMTEEKTTDEKLTAIAETLIPLAPTGTEEDARSASAS